MPERRVREVSRRVVSTRVLGSANPIAKWGRDSKSTCMDSIGGFFVGILLCCATFALPYCAATKEKDSKDVAKLTPVAVEQAGMLDGRAAVTGTLSTDAPVIPPKGSAGAVLAYRYVVEDYETHPETHTETHTEVQNGKEVEVTEEVTEDVSEWVTKIDETKWAPLKLGAINIDPQRADMQLTWIQDWSQNNAQNTHRERVEVVKLSPSVLLAAEFNGGQVAVPPDFYIVTTQSKDQLVASMNATEETGRWVLIIASVILWTISFNLIIGPAMILLNILPVQALSGAIRGVYTFFSLLLAVLLTWTVYVAVRYWWMILIVLAVLVVVIINAANRHRRAQPQLEVEEGPPAPPTQ
jgi:hypothetical protein